jgi:hypothetical protein
MKTIRNFKDKRKADPYVDRRSGEDRRQVYDSEYWEMIGIERRKLNDRRQRKERRANFVNVSQWSSVGLEDSAAQSYLLGLSNGWK